MGDVGFFVSQSHRSDEAFHLDRLSCKAFANKGGFCHHALPRFALTLASLDDLEHLIFSNTPDLG